MLITGDIFSAGSLTEVVSLILRFSLRCAAVSRARELTDDDVLAAMLFTPDAAPVSIRFSATPISPLSFFFFSGTGSSP